MINECHDQLLGRAGKMQVKGADMGLAHNLGGPGAVSAVAVLSSPEGARDAVAVPGRAR